MTEQPVLMKVADRWADLPRDAEVQRDSCAGCVYHRQPKCPEAGTVGLLCTVPPAGIWQFRMFPVIEAKLRGQV